MNPNTGLPDVKPKLEDIKPVIPPSPAAPTPTKPPADLVNKQHILTSPAAVPFLINRCGTNFF